MSNVLFKRNRQAQMGFTLVELMIVVAIIAILASVALPQYSSYVVRSKLPDATSNLSTLQVKMEQFYQDNRTYVGAGACTSNTSLSKYYTFSCVGTPTATTYTLQAVGTGTMTGFTFTVDQAGTKATTVGAGAPTGWTGASCWITNKGGAC